MISFIIFITMVGVIPFILVTLVLKRHKRQHDEAQEDTSCSRHGFQNSLH
jgi:hypothetical protein